MRIVVVGATSEIAQRCCELWLLQGAKQLVLTGRNPEKLKRLASDFRVRYPDSEISEAVFNHLNVKDIESFVGDVSSQTVDIVLIAHGSLTSQSKASVEADYLWAELKINALSPIVFAELWAGVLDRQGFGKLAVIGSVAGDRGRAINHGYGAAKSAMATYVAGLQHRFASSKVKVSLVKPGPTLTPMTRGVHVGPSKLADPCLVASQIVDGIERGKRVIYAPRVWALIMFVVRVMPFGILKRVPF